MAKNDSTEKAAKQQESGGFAKVQNPDGPDQLDANNTGRVGDAREYDRPAAASATEGWEAGNAAPETRYLSMDGQVRSEAGEGFRGSVLVAKGDTITPAVADQLKG